MINVTCHVMKLIQLIQLTQLKAQLTKIYNQYDMSNTQIDSTDSNIY